MIWAAFRRKTTTKLCILRMLSSMYPNTYSTRARIFCCAGAAPTQNVVNDNPLIHHQIVVPEVLVELVEQYLKKPFLRQLFSIHPYRSGVGHSVTVSQTEEVAERQAVADLLLCLFVAKVAHPMEHKNFEHQHTIVRFGTYAGKLLLVKTLLKIISKHFKINHFLKFFFPMDFPRS